MRLTFKYWAREAGIGLLFTAVIALLGHFNYTQLRLMPGMTVADWYFVANWLCFPFAKWAILEDHRQVDAPTIHRRRKHRAADDTASVYEKAHQRSTKLQAAPKTALAWYWRLAVDLLLAFIAPVVLGGFLTYLLRHN